MKKGLPVWYITKKAIERNKKVIVIKGEKPYLCSGNVDLRKRVCRKCFSINKRCLNG